MRQTPTNPSLEVRSKSSCRPCESRVKTFLSANNSPAMVFPSTISALLDHVDRLIERELRARQAVRPCRGSVLAGLSPFANEKVDAFVGITRDRNDLSQRVKYLCGKTGFFHELSAGRKQGGVSPLVEGPGRNLPDEPCPRRAGTAGSGPRRRVRNGHDGRCARMTNDIDVQGDAVWEGDVFLLELEHPSCVDRLRRR